MRFSAARRFLCRKALLRRGIAAFAALALAFASVTGIPHVSLPEAAAQGRGIALVRDAEIENTIRAYATPLLTAAGLTADNVQVNLVNDRVLNAFVAGGQRIFINTGLLIRAERAGQVVGVLAHEIGHIAGGHLARLDDQLGNATALMILGALIGAGAAVAGAGGDAVAAGVLGGQQLALRNLLQFTRTQESSADQAGASFLEATGQSVSGLVEFMRILGQQEALDIGRQDPYLRTHPLSADRVAALTARMDQSKYRNAPDRPEYTERFKRMQAKLVGYLEGLGGTLRKYPESDTSLYGRYARAFAYFQAHDFDRALNLIDGLIQEWPNDPYFHEMKSDILIDMGRVRDALPSAEAAQKLGPNEPLLAYGLARAQIATEDPALLPGATRMLQTVTRREPDNGNAWQQLAIAYGRAGDIGMASLASAERFYVTGNLRDARGQAERASRLLKEGTPGWLRAQDLIAAAKEERKLRDR